MLNRTLSLLLIALLSATPVAASKTEYQVGDRLPQAATKAAPARGGVRTLTWDDLLPPDWDPSAAFKGLDLASLDDADPRAMAALDAMRKAWDAAPVNHALDGQRVRIPGFVVSLDGGPGELREFLLVPYFGACIHVPPPPANQIIHVMPNRPVKNVRTMEAVWVSGTLGIGRSDTPMGRSGYRLQATEVTPYKAPR